MTVGAAEITKLIDELRAAKRPVFCSERDFQLQLAWQMKGCGWEVAMEYNPQKPNVRIDIFVYKPERVAVELKYKQALYNGEFEGLPLSLKSHNAQDHGRYDFWKDIWRLEKVVDESLAVRGFAIFLTNDGLYCDTVGQQYSSAMFSMCNGPKPRGNRSWSGNPAAGTTKGRPAFDLTRDYECGWKDYVKFDSKNGLFRYLLVEVEPAPAATPRTA